MSVTRLRAARCRSPDRRTAANKANSRKSTGPTSPAGKATSSANSVTHGMWARARPIGRGPFREDPQEVEEFVAGIVESLKPSSPLLESLAGEIANTRWLIERAYRQELVKLNGAEWLSGEVALKYRSGQIDAQDRLDLLVLLHTWIADDATRLTPEAVADVGGKDQPYTGTSVGFRSDATDHRPPLTAAPPFEAFCALIGMPRFLSQPRTEPDWEATFRAAFHARFTDPVTAADWLVAQLRQSKATVQVADAAFHSEVVDYELTQTHVVHLRRAQLQRSLQQQLREYTRLWDIYGTAS